MWYDGYSSSKKRNREQVRYVIPAWNKGDRVLHRPSGIRGDLVEMQTAGGELWKFLADCSCGGGRAAAALGLCTHRRAMTVHACDLELAT